MSQDTTSFITQQAKKRLIKDVSSIYKTPLNDQGIYYIHDDSDMLKGYAMIIGPKDTPYENGYYFFKFTFPHNYPTYPPTVTYMTNDGRTRFNPNLYRNGKVCVSVLNTWKGEGWTSCQTIRTILLTLVTLLNDTPLLNEPGIKKCNIDYDSYQEIIQYKNIEHAIYNMISKTSIPNDFISFYPFMVEHFLKENQNILNAIKKYEKNHPTSYTIKTSIYRMNIRVNWKKLYDQLTSIINQINQM